jgi:hypothetical protein
MTYNFRTIVNHVLRKTEFAPVSESVDSEFSGNNIDPFVERVKDWTNEVYFEIVNSGYWRFLESESLINTVEGQVNYLLASDCSANRIINVRETSTPALLKRKDFKDIDILHPDVSQTTSSTPVYYYFVNNQIYFHPVPDREITVKYRYYKTACELVYPEDVPAIPEHWKWVLVNGVLVKANQYLQDQTTEHAQIQYLNSLLQMRAANRADRQNKNRFKPCQED